VREAKGAVKPSPEPTHEQAPTARHALTDPGAADLLGQAMARENLLAAWKRVKANKGSAGVDARTVQETQEYLKTAWPDIRASVLDGSYRPAPVRRVGIAKPGGGIRELGIPTVVDRLIQQALLQILQPLIDPSFSEHSHGFRPGRGAHGALRQARHYVSEGYTFVVDVDLEKFFDRVNHDILMGRLAKRIADRRTLKLIRLYLQAGVMADGICVQRAEGTPQGGPLSPLLANVLLDEVDRELERRGHKFVRYADDCNVYVKSQRAGQRVLQALRRSYGRLKLKLNEAKTAVGPVWGRKFLGYYLLRTWRGEVKLGVAPQSVQRLKERLRDLTKVTVGRSLEQVAADLRRYIPGWKAYFGLVQTPTTFAKLDGWLRTRLRMLQLCHWRHGPTIYRELRQLGASESLASQVASRKLGRWRTATTGLKRILTVHYFDRLGVPKFS
jgi:RNA-directed DNA polymerase